MSISEDGGRTTVTASLDGLSSADVIVTVSATAVEPAVANDFRLSVNRELTIRAGQLQSTGTVTIEAEDNEVDAPDKTVEVTASASGGNGVAAPAAQTLTITDDDDTARLTLTLDPTSIGENGGRSTVTASIDRPSSEAVTLTVTVEPTLPAVETDFELTGDDVDDRPGRDGEHGDCDDRGREQRRRRAGQDGRGEGVGPGRPGRGETRRPKTLTIIDDEEAPEVTLKLDPTSISEDGGQDDGDGIAGRVVQRGRDADGDRGPRPARRRDGLRVDGDNADDHRGRETEHRGSDDHGREQHHGRPEQGRRGDGGGVG